MFQRHKLYYFSLVGATAGFFTWALGWGISEVWEYDTGLLFNRKQVELWLMGGLIGVLPSWFHNSELYDSNKQLNIFKSAVLGLIAGMIGSVMIPLISQQGRLLAQNLWLITILKWLVMGLLLGMAIGLSKYPIRAKKRILLSIVGGVGGSLFGVLPLLVSDRMSLPVDLAAPGLMLIGAGICFGANGTIEYMKTAVFTFSGMVDHTTSSPFGKSRPEWSLLSNEEFLVGNDQNQEKDPQFIHLPIPFVKPEHVYIAGDHSAFYLIRHNSNQTPEGDPMYVSYFDKDLKGYVQATNHFLLKDQMELKIGKAKFRFHYLKNSMDK